MSCYNCGGCEQTSTMNACFETFTVSGLPNTTDITLTFESKADGKILIAEGTTNGSGVLTIQAEDMPPLINGFSYKLSFSETWTGGDCAIVTFVLMSDSNGVITGTAEVLTVC